MNLSKWLFIFIIASLFGFAQGNADDCDEAAIEIIEADLSSVKGSTGNKLYLNEENLSPTAQGIVLSTGQFETISIRHLYSDEHGCYLKISDELSRSIQEGWSGWNGNVLNTCPGCGLKYFVLCDNPDCHLKQERDERREQKKKKRN
ncbi:MAG: hypothetical protein P0S96_08280 [Simkaniaceae bacterium]|nr:hypothetical protein [Candidatus Sacchlamyda saccharinae]